MAQLNLAGVWKFVINGYVKIGSTWRTISNGWVNIGGTWRPFQIGTIAITLNTGNEQNIYTLAGSPTSPVNVIVTIPNGIYATSRNNAGGVISLDTGTGWAVGTTITIINNGNIIGHGGLGGVGASVNDLSLTANATGGGAGGTALNLQWDVTLDNTNGLIAGGGGGGGGGRGQSFDANGTIHIDLAGGGGGGGQGYFGGIGGNGGVGISPSGSQYGADNTTSGAGVGGDLNGSGNGGPGVTATNALNHPVAASGGNGGLFGAAGGSGGANYVQVNNFGRATGNGGTDGAGGAAGKAINLNGHACTITGGNNSSQIIGAVS